MRIEGSYGWNRTAGGLRRLDPPPLLALVELPIRLGREGRGLRELVAMSIASVNVPGRDCKFNQREGSGSKRMGGVFECGNCAPGVVVEVRRVSEDRDRRGAKAKAERESRIAI
jgi:hypothetical protein